MQHHMPLSTCIGDNFEGKCELESYNMKNAIIELRKFTL
jgi:hypothetical protein